MKNVKSKIMKSIRAGWPALLIGGPGIGKTEVCGQVAEELGFEFLVETATTSDPTDARGLPAIIDGQARCVPLGQLRHIIDTKKEILYLIDDLGQASGEVQKSYMHLILARQVGEHKVGPNVHFIATTNDIGNQNGVINIIAPLQNRMFHVHVTPHVETWCNWANEHEVHPMLIGFVRATPGSIEKTTPPVGIRAVSTPRSLKMLSDFVKGGASDLSTYTGCIGEEIGRQFAAFEQLYNQLTNISEILRNPKSAPVPKEIDRRYALGAALSIQESGWDKILLYLERWPMELVVMIVSDATRRYPDLLKSTPIKGWIKQNKEILL